MWSRPNNKEKRLDAVEATRSRKKSELDSVMIQQRTGTL